VERKNFAEFVWLVAINTPANHNVEFLDRVEVCDQVCKLALLYHLALLGGRNLGNTMKRIKYQAKIKKELLALARSIGCKGVAFNYDLDASGPRLVMRNGYSNCSEGDGIAIPR
jgi:hypothetical protein